MSEPTPEQAAAIGRRGVSVVLSSGAGCGKTSVLTARFLDYLRLGEARVGEIVAITFTDRAAREMRRRIRQQITSVRDSGSVDAELWSEHLRDLESAAIQTIHSFCSNLLHRYALVAGLDPAFEVLEDSLADSLRDTTLDETLRTLVIAESPLGDDLRMLVEICGWRSTRDAIDNLLTARGSRDRMAWAAQAAAKIAEDWRQFSSVDLQPRLIRHGLANDSRISDCIALLRMNPCRGPKMAANVRAVLDGVEQLAAGVNVLAAIEAIGAAAYVQGTEKQKAWDDVATYDQIRVSLEQLRKAIPKLAPPAGDDGDVEAAAEVARRFVRVAQACRQEYAARKRQHARVDFDDQILLARNLLRDRREVREEIRRRYRYLLLDELQDTDPVQMEIVELLCGPGLTAGKLFAVGDSKQSIYRFRGADETLFRKLRDRVPVEGRLSLTVNFRSQPAILTFVNHLFTGSIPDYEPLTPRREQLTPGPCVEFLWSDPSAGNADFCREMDAARVAARIRKMVNDAEPLVATENGELRGVRPGDVILLFRAMTDVALYERALDKEGLDYYLVGGRAFFAQQEVYDLLNVLRAIENPLDALSLAGALRSPFGGLSDESLYWLAQNKGGLWAGLSDSAMLATLSEADRPHVERAARFLRRWRSVKDRLPIAGLIEFMLNDCGYDAALQFESLGDRKLANLWKLIELARTFDRSGLFGIADFIHRLSASVTAQPREEQAATLPEESDVVRIMSIHQAKGLEFPVVFLPDIGKKPGGPRGPCAEWDDRIGCVLRPPSEDEPPLFSRLAWDALVQNEDLASWTDDLNTFYVACTRAKDYLVLSGAVDLAKPESNTAMTILAKRYDLQTAAPINDAP